MREVVEFRIPEDLAQRYLPVGSGTRLRLGISRKLNIDLTDPIVSEIRRIDGQLRARGEGAFFTSWEIRRQYSCGELEKAEMLHAWPRREFEPSGEECGTEYNESNVCPECGAGAVQKTPLFLDGRRIPRKLDFARTIAGEIVVSARVLEVFRQKQLVGAKFDAVRKANAGGAPSSEYFQLNIVGPAVELDAATRAGGNLFDESGYGRCARGHVVGLNLLSEVHIQRRSLVAADAMITKQMVGVRRGLLRPRPILLISPKAWRAIEDAKLRGLGIEVAHLALLAQPAGAQEIER